MIDGIIPQHSINHVPRWCSSSILNRCLEGQNAAETTAVRVRTKHVFKHWLIGCFNSFPKNITSCHRCRYTTCWRPGSLRKPPNSKFHKGHPKGHPAAPPGDLEHSPCRSYSEHRLAGSSFLSLHPPEAVVSDFPGSFMGQPWDNICLQ